MSSADTLMQRHDSFNTPEESIFNIVKNETVYTPIQKTKIIKGFDSEVYEIETKEQHPLIFKIKHFGSISYTQESWAINESKKNDVPVPTILTIGEMTIDNERKEYTIQEKVEGTSLDELRSIKSDSEIITILHNAGEMLRRIHNTKVDGLYHRHDDGKWDFTSWDRYAEVVVRDRSLEKDEILQAGFHATDFDKMVHFLKIYRDEFTCKQPVLCHGDYLPGHIFVNDSFEITGIIDFGMFSGNHPIHDFAFFAIEVPSLNISSLVDGYGEHEMFHDRFEKRLLLHMLTLEMGHLTHAIRTNLKSESDFMITRLKDTLEKLS